MSLQKNISVCFKEHKIMREALEFYAEKRLVSPRQPNTVPNDTDWDGSNSYAGRRARQVLSKLEGHSQPNKWACSRCGSTTWAEAFSSKDGKSWEHCSDCSKLEGQGSTTK